MARKVVTTLVDDLDGRELGEDGSTVPFGLDGVEYEIDLSGDNAEALRSALGSYIQSGRRIASAGKRATRSKTSTASKSTGDLAAAREWLREHGHQIADRGRISADLLEQYRNRDGGSSNSQGGDSADE